MYLYFIVMTRKVTRTLRNPAYQVTTKMINIRSTSLLIFVALASEPLLAQALPSCRSIISDTDGDGYGWENDGSCVVTSTSLESPAFTNLETGETVNLVRAYWNESDFTRNDISCVYERFNGSQYSLLSTESTDVGLFDFRALSETAPFTGDIFTNFSSVATETWSLNDGIYQGPSALGKSPWVEIIDFDRQAGPLAPGTRNAVRIWQSDGLYTQCLTANPRALFVPTGSPPETIDTTQSTVTASDTCDYSNAAQHDGWGWNATSGTSCAPLNSITADNCDYSNADAFDGWGWDPVAAQSCAPLAESNNTATVDSDCDYSNAQFQDGWGWNPITGLSCPPL